MVWHNHTEKTYNELAIWLTDNGLKIAKVGTITQDILGNWHIFYSD